jgi:hypothetical protein
LARSNGVSGAYRPSRTSSTAVLDLLAANDAADGRETLHSWCGEHVLDTSGMTMPATLQQLVEAFVTQLVRLVEQVTVQRIQSALSVAIPASGAELPRPRARVAATRAARADATPVGRRVRLTAKLARARRLQGQYLGLLRSLNAEARTRVKREAKEKGVEAALVLARSIRS